VLALYSFTAALPKQETYGLAAQMRRAAVSIPANVVEGFRRRGKADKARFLNIAEGSLEESRYLSTPGSGSRLRKNSGTAHSTRGSQPFAQSLLCRYSQFCLLTSASCLLTSGSFCLPK